MKKGFTPLEVQNDVSVNVWTKAKPTSSLRGGITERSDKLLTGFTLTELLVVAGIIFLMMGIVFTSWRSGPSELLLQRSAHKLAQDIRRAGELAMSAREFQGAVPQGGYGIHFKFPSENTSYILYADLNGNESYDSPDGVVETILFEKGVFLKSITQDNLSINFRPPSPKISLDSLSAVSITLSLQSDQTQTKIVNVNLAGLIEVE